MNEHRTMPASLWLPQQNSAHLEQLQRAGYDVRSTVSAGRFGLVYHATDLTVKREVAIKLLDATAMRATRGPHSEAEIETLASIRHPHIVPLYSSGVLDDGVRYFVMPWIGGPSVRTRLKNEQRLPLVDALRMGVEIADALTALHAHGLVHRDVKPANVLVDGRHAVLIDFGLVCLAHAAALDDDEVDPVVGTPAYMSPEQWQPGAAMDGRADIFGLGCLLYEALTGISPNDEILTERTPTSPFTWEETHPSVDDVDPYDTPARPVVSLRVRRPDAPEALDRVLRRALRLDRENRMSSAAVFRDTLEQILATQLADQKKPNWLKRRFS